MKKINFAKIKKYIKLVIANPTYNRTLKKLNQYKVKENRAIFIGSPIHGNLGDHLIASESVKYIEKFGFDEIIEVPEFLYEIFNSKIIFSPNDIIFISGGGWMGSLYEDELVIESITSKWKKNLIIILPQTISFTKGNYSSIEQLKDSIKFNNLIVTAREKNSFDLTKEIINSPTQKSFLLPDMGLLRFKAIKKEDKLKNTSNCIIFSMREDKEKIDNFDISKIKEQIKNSNKYVIKYSSSVINKKIVPIKRRESELNKKINEFSKVELVITDRLHSMIFALIAGTKCIVLDNSTKKVSGVYNTWLKNTKGLYFLQNKEELTYELITKIMNSSNKPEGKNFEQYFKELNELIGEIL